MKADRRIGGGSSAPHYRQVLIAGITQFLGSLRDLPDPKAQRTVWWTPFRAALAAVLMVLDHGCSLRVRFEEARMCMASDFPRRSRAGQTYTGLLKALERQAQAVLPVLKQHLQQQAAIRLARLRRGAKWLLLAVDGSKEDLPRTRDQEQTFGIADNGIYPQALITIIVEVMTGLLWDWRIDRARGSEKGHLLDMAAHLPSNALLLGDGNFVGFKIWSALAQAGQPFLIRVGGNVRLITHLWPEMGTRRRGDIVYIWPKKQQRISPPLRFRLIQVGQSNQTVYLLTNILDRRQLSRKEAGAIYRLRWGVELSFRTFKRTLGYAKLHSRTGRRARIELEWAMITMMIMTMMGIDAATRRRIDPSRLSPAHLLRILRACLLRGRCDGMSDERDLHRNLVSTLKDNYQRRRPKASRHRPQTRVTPNLSLRPPEVRRATKQERQLAMKHQNSLAA